MRPRKLSLGLSLSLNRFNRPQNSSQGVRIFPLNHQRRFKLTADDGRVARSVQITATDGRECEFNFHLIDSSLRTTDLHQLKQSRTNPRLPERIHRLGSHEQESNNTLVTWPKSPASDHHRSCSRRLDGFTSLHGPPRASTTRKRREKDTLSFVSIQAPRNSPSFALSFSAHLDVQFSYISGPFWLLRLPIINRISLARNSRLYHIMKRRHANRLELHLGSFGFILSQLCLLVNLSTSTSLTCERIKLNKSHSDTTYAMGLAPLRTQASKEKR